MNIKHLKSFTARNLLLTRLSFAAHLALGAAKVLLGWWSRSLLLVVSGLHNGGIAFAKLAVLKGAKTEFSRRDYRRVGRRLAATSLLYCGYALILLLRGGDGAAYDQIAGISIATFTFAEITMAVYGTLKARRVKSLAAEASKRINLASSLISLVLTQAALIGLSETRNIKSYSGALGLVLGAFGAAIGLHMIFRRKKL